MYEGVPQKQLMLFHKQLTWRELPEEVRQRTIDLAATMCVEIVTEQSTQTQEEAHESSQD